MTESLPLRDIHLPDAVSWWPPAPGWWLLVVLGLLLLFALYRLWCYLRRPRLDKIAVAEVERLLADPAVVENPLDLLRRISALLRRIGISYLSREAGAGITGHEWYAFLNRLTERAGFSEPSIEMLCNAPYQSAPAVETDAVDRLCTELRAWARALPEKPRPIAAGRGDV
jgi:hypothetical protein